MIFKIFSKGSSLSSVVPGDFITAFEVYDPQQVNEEVVEIAVVQRWMKPVPRSPYLSEVAINRKRLP